VRAGRAANALSVVERDALTRPEHQEPDRRQDKQVAGQGDPSPAMVLAEFSGDGRSG